MMYYLKLLSICRGWHYVDRVISRFCYWEILMLILGVYKGDKEMLKRNLSGIS